MKKDLLKIAILIIGIILGVIGVCIWAFGWSLDMIFPGAFHFVIKSIIFVFSCLLGWLVLIMGISFADADSFQKAFENMKAVVGFFMTIPKMFKKTEKNGQVKQKNVFWIPIKKLKEGMFSTEYVMIIESANGQEMSYFVDKYLITQNNGTYFVKTTLIKKTENSIFVLLPDATYAEIKRNDKLNFKTLFLK